MINNFIFLKENNYQKLMELFFLEKDHIKKIGYLNQIIKHPLTKEEDLLKIIEDHENEFGCSCIQNIIIDSYQKK